MEDLRKISDLSDPAQWYPEARAFERKIIFHAGPTNSGKTYHALERFSTAKSGVYCGPLKLLANEVERKTNGRGIPCDLVTGEERKYAHPDDVPSGHVACTVEMTSVTQPYEVAVIDEIQMLRDATRGWAWTRALLGVAAKEIHLCGEEAAIPLVRSLMLSTGEEVEVRRYKRLTSLTVLDKHLGSLENVRPGDCIVAFSKNDLYSLSRQIEALGKECAVIYGSLPPGAKLNQASKFNDPSDPCKILVATDAIGMGLNLSIKRIIFNSLIRPMINEKGEKEMDRLTTSQDIFVNLSQVEKNYFVCNVDDFKFLADMIQHIPLHLRARYVFCCSPINKKHPFICTMFLKFARQYSRNEPITFEWFSRQIGWPLATPKNIRDLMHLEAVHDVMDLYLWLSYRFMDMFPDTSIIRDVQQELDSIIQQGVINITKLIRASETKSDGVAALPDDDIQTKKKEGKKGSNSKQSSSQEKPTSAVLEQADPDLEPGKDDVNFQDAFNSGKGKEAWKSTTNFRCLERSPWTIKPRTR
ncbi:putative ATP-dependent RNA helicase SUPV3L1, mitochondrial isoform X2 [Apostichopus japonicus]|uniref:RNA helicase n=1 Tax=Stichopus japonicus TaxID=307972 RepID=A0A2G8KJA4_STIJA|nr:putative ATP-dependent RNA helicase SUPV3L1, mitochondrial isoform X2 [Apostichopus japonicus]